MDAEVRSDYIHSKAMPDLIAKLLAQRQAMLVSFNRLVELKPYSRVSPVQPVLQQFCQLLMDYLALGHFEVYQCLEASEDESVYCRHFKYLARELYPRITDTTRTAVNFNDRYDGQNNGDAWDVLGDELSFLGEQLADRIELEDRLIGAMRAALLRFD